MASKDYRIDITAKNKTQRQFDQINQSLGKTTKSMAFMKKSLIGVFSVAAIGAFSKAALQTADDLAKVSASIGVGAEFLQRFQFAAEQSGVSAEGFDKSMKFFSKTMGESTMGLGLGLDAIQQLGVSLQDTAGNTKKIDVLFLEMMLALDGVTNSTERAGLATKLFGRAGIPMVNMLREGHQGMLDLAAVAPGVLTDEDTKRAEDFNDAMNVIARTIKGPLMSAVINLVDVPRRIREGLRETFDEWWTRNMEEFYGPLKVGFVEPLKETGEELKIVDKRLIAFADRVKESMKSSTDKVAEFREELEEAVQAGIFDQSKVEEAVEIFRKSIEKGVGDTVTVVKQFEDTIEGSLEKAFQDFFDRTNEGFLNMQTLMKSVVDEIIKEVLRLAVIKPIVDMIMGSGPMKALSSIFGERATGGPVSAGNPYIVGEKGPELFVPGSSGGIVPNNQLATAGAGTNVNVTFDIKSWDSRDTLQAISQQAPAIVGIVEQSFRKRGRRGPLGP